MDTRFLESFVTVASCGSIAEAARRLNLTPAAVAQRLRALEAELGHSLVSRTGRTVRPTASGLAVLAEAHALLEATRALKAAAANDMPAGQLRLGATATALTGLLPAILATLGQNFPRIEVFVRPGASVDLYHALLAGECDAAILVRPHFPIPKSHEWLTLRDEPLVLIAPEDTPIEDPHAALTQAPFIRYDRNQWGGQIVDRYLRKQGLKLREWLELDALDAIAALVDRGLGLAIVPEWAPPWPEGLRLQKVRLDAGDVRQTGVLWGRSGPRIAAVRAFVECCQQSL
ncbi:LysR family transcriptional regulator [Aminobacter sp. J44]|uniref:LysR family transcriptional regulator n=1 Tax=Aminobacter sp. J44 TaxID=935262 RepID=UPI001198DC74|nr:LysR family transcriptional regulator [Aminobacter sp. J44]TWG64081.1 DNA-binding transcriptional LysR family regulator [Aminobacter sp. J44]